MQNFFKFEKFNTSFRQEIIAGLITFLTTSYILFVHPIILSEAGMPQSLSIIATILISFLGSLLMGLIANVPLVMAPGMGINAFFTFTLVEQLGFTWQESLGIVIITGSLFFLFALSGLMDKFSKAIPPELKTAITVGIGLFLVTIGLENAGFISAEGSLSWNWLGFVGLLALLGLTKSKVKGSYLLVILFVTGLYWILSPETLTVEGFHFQDIANYSDLLRAPSFSNLLSFEAIIGIFSLAMFLIFETIGMVEAFVPDHKRISKGYKVGAFISMVSGLLGTSPAIPVAENGAGVQEGGRTGLTAISASVFFLLAIFLMPFFALIPAVAIGPVIIFTGLSMASLIRFIEVPHWSFWIPVLLMVILIPLTGNIVNGMAYSFISYPIVAILFGNKERTNPVLNFISILFLLMLVLNFL